VNPIAPYKKVGLSTRDHVVPVALHELGPGASRRVGTETGEVVVDVGPVGPEPSDHGPVQHAEQFAAMDRELRPPIPGSNA
jgi:hypothetical protein